MTAEKNDLGIAWPRANSCLYNFCPAKRPECEKCDEIVRALRRSSLDISTDEQKKKFAAQDALYNETMKVP